MIKYDSQLVSDLAVKILHHKTLYYRGNPKISDASYDALEKKLKDLAPSHPALSAVGSDEVVVGSKIKHAKPMLSLAKTYEVSELMSWAKEHKLIGTVKIDGNSISLIYQKGKLTVAKTRGNGRVGEDVSAKVRWVSDCVPELPKAEGYEVRGEMYCTGSQFIKLSREMQRLELEKPTNPRNTVAGILGRKQYISLARYFNFAAFDVLDLEGNSPFKTEVEKFKWLKAAGFNLPDYQIISKPAGVENFLDYSRDYMESGDVGIDGAVFTYDDIELHNELGETSHHPRYKMSFKWQGETANSVIKDFTWATSRLGIVTPVAVIDPVYLSGASITNVTLHNAAHVKLFNLKVGDEIEIVRSGEVIPKFLRVVKEGKGSARLLEDCPSCGEELEFDDVRLLCPNQFECPAQQIGSILNWIRCVEIDDLSEKRLLPLLEMDMISHAADLYKLSVDDFLELPLTKEKMAKKLFENIQKSKSLPLANFLNGLGIQGAGLTTWEALLEHYPSLELIQAATVEELIAIDGFAEKSSEQIVSGLIVKNSDIKKFINVGVSPQTLEKKKVSADSILSGRTLVITGTMDQPRAELEKSIKAAGGKVSGSVSKKTFALVIDDLDSSSSKAKKARELGIEMWSEETLLSHF